MSVNIRDYVSNDHVESIGEIAKSQSAIIQALSIDNSKLQQELQRKNNIINELKYGIQKIRDLFYEKFRIHDEDGYYSMNDTDLQDFYDILDKIKDIENGNK